MEQIWTNQQAICSKIREKIQDIRHNIEKHTASRDSIHNERLLPEIRALQRSKENLIQKYDTKLMYVEQQINHSAEKKLEPNNAKKNNICNKKQILEDELEGKLEQLQTQYDTKVSALKLHYEGRIKLLDNRSSNLTAEEEEDNKRLENLITYYTTERTRLETLKESEIKAIEEKIHRLEQREPSKLELTLKIDLERAEKNYESAKQLEEKYHIDFERQYEEEKLQNRSRTAEADIKTLERAEAIRYRLEAQSRIDEIELMKREKEEARERNRIADAEEDRINRAKEKWFAKMKQLYPTFHSYDATTMPSKLIRIRCLDKKLKSIHTFKLMKLSEFRKEFPFYKSEPDELLSDDED